MPTDHEGFCITAALDDAYEAAHEAGLLRWLGATRVDPGYWEHEVEVTSSSTVEDGYRIVCSLNGSVIRDATYQVEGGFGDDGRTGRPVLQEVHYENGGPEWD